MRTHRRLRTGRRLRSCARLFGVLLLIFALTALPAPAAALLQRPDAPDANELRLRSTAITLSDHSAVHVYARLKKVAHAEFILIAASAPCFGPSLRLEQLCHFTTPPRQADARWRAYEATGPPPLQ